MLTAYDYPSALILDRSEVDIVLVGDSLAMVMLGHENTLSIGMDEMLHHTRAVAAGCKRALVVGDMPYGSYQNGITQAIQNGTSFIKEGRLCGSETGRRKTTRSSDCRNGSKLKFRLWHILE